MHDEELAQVAHLLQRAGRGRRAGPGPLEQLVEEGACAGVVLEQEGLVAQRVEDMVLGEAPAQTAVDLYVWYSAALLLLIWMHVDMIAQGGAYAHGLG